MKEWEAYPLAFIQADINGTAELNVSAFRELESAEFRRQEVAVHGVEVFEQVGIDGASEREKSKVPRVFGWKIFYLYFSSNIIGYTHSGCAYSATASTR